MNPGTFDQLTRRFAARFSRRTLLGGALGTLALGVTSSHHHAQADTPCNRYKRFNTWNDMAFCEEIVQIKEPSFDWCSVPPIEHVSVPNERRGYSGDIIKDVGDSVAANAAGAAVQFRDGSGTADFLPACQAHDRCYATCGASKDSCDSAFVNDLSLACVQAYSAWWQAPLLLYCGGKAEVYYEAVSKSSQGRTGYENLQTEHCGCCEDFSSEPRTTREVETACGTIVVPSELFSGSLMLGGDAARTGQQPGPGPGADAAVDRRFLESFTANRDAPSSCRVRVMEGTPLLLTMDSIYVGGTDGSEANGPGSIWWGIFCLDPLTGTRVWFAPLAAGSTGGVGVVFGTAIGEGALFVTAMDRLFRLDANTGAIVWQIERIGGPSSPVVVDGMVLLVAGRSTTGAFYAYDANSGAERWVTGTGENLWGSIAVTSGVAMAIGPAGLYSVNTAGEPGWTYDTSRAAESLALGPVVANGMAYVATGEGIVIAVSITNGQEAWRSTVTEGQWISGLSSAGDRLIAGVGQGLVGLDVHTHESVWMVPGDGTAFSSAAIADGVAYAVTLDGLVVAVDVETGTIVWTVSTPVTGQYGNNGRPSVLPQPGVVNRRVAFTNAHGWVYVISD